MATSVVYHTSKSLRRSQSLLITNTTSTTARPSRLFHLLSFAIYSLRQNTTHKSSIPAKIFQSSATTISSPAEPRTHYWQTHPASERSKASTSASGLRDPQTFDRLVSANQLPDTKPTGVEGKLIGQLLVGPYFAVIIQQRTEDLPEDRNSGVLPLAGR